MNFKGRYKVFDCFGNYIGFSEPKLIQKLLNIGNSAISSAISRNSHLKSLKFIKV